MGLIHSDTDSKYITTSIQVFLKCGFLKSHFVSKRCLLTGMSNSTTKIPNLVELSSLPGMTPLYAVGDIVSTTFLEFFRLIKKAPQTEVHRAFDGTRICLQNLLTIQR